MLHNTFIRKRKPFRHHHHCQLILMYQQCRGRRLKSVFISSFILAILLYSTPQPQNCTSKMTLSEKNNAGRSVFDLISRAHQKTHSYVTGTFNWPSFTIFICSLLVTSFSLRLIGMFSLNYIWFNRQCDETLSVEFYGFNSRTDLFFTNTLLLRLAFIHSIVIFIVNLWDFVLILTFNSHFLISFGLILF